MQTLEKTNRDLDLLRKFVEIHAKDGSIQTTIERWKESKVRDGQYQSSHR